MALLIASLLNCNIILKPKSSLHKDCYCSSFALRRLPPELLHLTYVIQAHVGLKLPIGIARSQPPQPGTSHTRTCSPALTEIFGLCMISRRSNPRGFGVSRLELMKEATAGASKGDSVESSVFFCVAVTSRGKKDRLSYFRSSAVGEDAEAACALAALCLDHAPEHHRWHHHTYDGRRTFAVLAADDGRTYLAIAEPTPGSAEVVRFLERVRETCSAAPRRRLRDEAVSHLVRQFAQTLQAGASSSAAANSVMLPGDGSWSEHASDKDEEAQPEEGAPLRRPGRPSWRRTWWRRHAMAVIGVDVVLCLVLFGVWMAVCHGFSCVQR